MNISAHWRSAAVLAAVGSLFAAGCGGGGGGNSSNQPESTPQKDAKAGGALTVLYAGDVDSIDPAITYYQYGMNVAYATQRPLYSYKPDDAKTPEPDLAEGPPEISPDGKTVTVKIRTGVKFSPPVNREVTTKDVKYALERSFTPQVPNGYVNAYMGDLLGLEEFKSGKAKDIKGIETPDDQTIVFKLARPRGAIVAGALSMPASAPVPPEYAKKFDQAKGQSQYGNNHVATGPYMVENDDGGKLTGYKPGSEIRLVRNPSWDAATDYKPAYLDSITIKEGSDPEVAARQIVEGNGMVSGDFQLTSSTLSRVSKQNKDLLVVTPPTGRFRYIALNTTKKPFDDLDVRKAVVAAFDRTALRTAFGGPITGDIPTHFIPPGQPGFEEAGGAEGPGLDFLAKPEGDLELAKEYMKKAGYASGMYDGPELEAVSDNAPQQLNVSQIAQQQFAKLGFKVKLKAVTRDAMYTKFCQVRKAEPPICPSVGWLKDFADPETLLGPTFNGKNILDVGNSNFAQLDDPKVNELMDKAEVVNDPAERRQAWGDADKAITEAVPGVPWLWDKQPVLHSKDVNGVISQNLATWDLTATSIG